VPWQNGTTFHKPGFKFINTESNEVSISEVCGIARGDICFCKTGLITQFNRSKIFWPFLLYHHHCFAVRGELRLDVNLVSLCHKGFLPSLREGLSLGVRLVSLCQECFPPTLQEGLRLDVRFLCFCHECLPPSLRDGLRLDVRLVFLCHTYFLPSLREQLRLKTSV
jgi:hypothetical protein